MRQLDGVGLLPGPKHRKNLNSRLLTFLGQFATVLIMIDPTIS